MTTQTRKQYLADLAFWDTPEGRREKRAIENEMRDSATAHREKTSAEAHWEHDAPCKDVSKWQKRLEMNRQANWLAGNAGGTVERLGARPRINKQGNIERGTKAEVVPGGWYSRNRKDNRETFMDRIAKLELGDSSFISLVKKEQQEDGVSQENILKTWKGLSVFRVTRDMLTQPPVKEAKVKKAKVKKSRIELIIPEGPKDVNGHGPEMLQTMISYYTNTVKEIKDKQNVHEWRLFHKSMNSQGGMDFLPKPPTMTLFANPDGSRYLNKTAGTASPLQAKKKFMKIHKVEDKDASVERVTYMPGSPILEKLDLPNRQTTINVVCKRKRSDLGGSTYLDPKPHMVQQINREGEWEEIYRWQSSKLIKLEQCQKATQELPEGMREMLGMMVPNGARLLSVREFEMATLSGAEVIDDPLDMEISRIGDLEGNMSTTGDLRIMDELDDRLKGDDDLPRKDTKKFSEDEMAVYQTLISVERFELADIMTVDFASKVGERVKQEFKDQFATYLDPNDNNPHWINLLDDILQLKKEEYKRDKDGEATALKVAMAIENQLEDFITNLSE